MPKKKVRAAGKTLKAKVLKKVRGITVQKVNDKVAMLSDELARVTADVKTLAKQGKARYESLDEDSKRKAKIALGALAALLTMKAMSRAHRKKASK